MKRSIRKSLFVCFGQVVLVLVFLCFGTLVYAGGQKAQSGGTGNQGVTLSFRTWNPDDNVWDKAQIAALWDAKNTGIKVELDQVAYSDHYSSLKVNLASGEGPDMMGLQVGAPLEEFKEFCLDVAPRATQTWGQNWESKWFPTVMALTKGKLDSYYGLPLGSSYAGYIWANMTYFNKYNLKVPSNFNELLAVTKAFRSHGELPLVIGAKDDWINLDMFINIVSDINGQKFFDAVEGKSPFTDPDIIKALTIWKSCFDLGIFQDGALGVNVYNDTTSIFQDEQLAPMICNGVWVVNGIDDFGKGTVFDVFTMDWNNDGKPAPVAPTVDVVMSINKASKHLDETWQFYSWFVSEGIKSIINYNVMYLPALVDHKLDSSKFSPEMQKDLTKSLDIAKDRAAFYREISYPRLKQTIADQLKAVALGESTPQQAADIIETASKAEKR